MSSSSQPGPGPPLKILSLDGGGARGLSSLLILEKIMELIKESEGLSKVPRPCEKFNLIGGSGTGGIIAIMLGRLSMTVDQSIKEYKTLIQTAFNRKRTKFFIIHNNKRSTSNFETAIKNMIRRNCNELGCAARRERDGVEADECPHENILFADANCTKTAVLAMTKHNVSAPPTILKTYDVPTDLAECEVWEVTRATSAVITLFGPIKIGREKVELIDANHGYNNPCEILIQEAEKQFPGKNIMTLSIGTGIDSVVDIGSSRRSYNKAISQAATSSQTPHGRLSERYIKTGGYYRFDVDKGLENTSYTDGQKVSDISAHTRNYMKQEDSPIRQFVEDFINSNLPSLQNDQTGHQRSDYEDEKDKQCLSNLYITDPCTDKESIEIKKGGLLRDCYKWVLDDTNFQNFRKDSQSRILWIKGDPGKGKTMLMCGLVNELQSSPSVTLSYFFCQATSDSSANTATSVLRGLIYHLARCNPQLTRHVRDKYDYKKDFLASRDPWPDLCAIITNMLADPSLKNVILMVDALDECNKDLEKLLDLIIKPSQAKWIVSSRNWPDIEQKLDDAEQQIKIHLELNEESVSKAVKSYIDFKVNHLAKIKKYDEGLKNQVLEHLTTNSQGTFLWVALVCQELSHVKVYKRHTMTILEAFPPGLDPLYKRMLECVYDSHDKLTCIKILTTTLTVYRPTSLEELHSLVEELAQYDAKEVKEIIGSCGFFLTVYEDIVYFVHQSAKDYLLKKASAPDIIPQHQIVFKQSLNLFQKTLKRDVYRLQAPGCLIDEISFPSPDPLAAVKYSCVFWVDHFYDSIQMGMASGMDEIQDFFLAKYLQWLEALSLLRGISDAGNILKRLEVCLQDKASQNLQNIVKDARRFLLLYGGIIEAAPLQVYVSALLFSPTNSLTKQNFKHEQPDWIEVSPRVEESWDPCLRTLEGHDDNVTSVAFSHDGHRLASGSADNTVKIWDSTSGTCLQTLEGHDDFVYSVLFSDDGKLLASGSGDKTVKIWDLTSGRCLWTLKGHEDYVGTISFTSDGRQLASGSWDKTIKIWDVTSGTCLHTLEGHDDRVMSVIFLRDRDQLASGSRDETVKKWDITSGTCLETLEGRGVTTELVLSKDGLRLASGLSSMAMKISDATSGASLQYYVGHNDPVMSLAFSNDGRWLASGSTNPEVRIWDTNSDECLLILHGHADAVRSVALSNDRQLLASGSDDHTVKIWDPTSDTCSRNLEDHGSSVRLMVFSNDRQRLASGSDDKTIKIWDATSGELLCTLEGHKDFVETVLFTNDGRQLASGAWDRTIKIWDVSSEACLRTLKGHRDWVTSVVFSTNGQRLASGSRDQTAKIWDITSGTCLQTLEGHSNCLKTVVFSPDEQWLASGSDDKTVKIWDATSGACLQTLKGHGQTVESVVFSKDGQRLASGSSDNTVKIWDSTSGTCLQTLEGHDDSVYSVLFSNDSQRLASWSRNKTTRIWDSISGACLRVLSTGNTIYSASTELDISGVEMPVTDVTPSIHQSSLVHYELYSYGFSDDNRWLTKDGQRLVWLPPDYRPTMLPVVSSAKIALACPDDRVIVIGFKSTTGHAKPGI